MSGMLLHPLRDRGRGGAENQEGRKESILVLESRGRGGERGEGMQKKGMRKEERGEADDSRSLLLYDIADFSPPKIGCKQS